MPYVAIKLIKELTTPEVKAKFIARISHAVADVIVEGMGADKEKVLAHTWCVVEEVPFDNWGLGGVPLTLEILKEALGVGE
jgi:4-oxalocrotonate tautomerase family enzyme